MSSQGLDGLPLSLAAALDRVRDQFYVLDADCRVRFWNERVREVTGYDESRLAGAPLSGLFDDGEALADAVAAAGDDRVVGSATAAVETADGSRVEVDLAVEAIREDGAVVGYTVLAWPAAATGASHGAVARHREQVDRLQRINAVVRDTLTVAIRVDDREALVRQVCERLAEEASYDYVWIVTPAHVAGQFTVDATAGEGGDYHEALAAADVEVADPVARAYRAGETVVEHDVGDGGEWATAASERGFASAIAVPIRYGAATHAVLGVLSERPDVFDDAERELLEELCSGIAYAVNALSLREAISADRVVELGFDLAADHPLSGIAAASGGVVDLRTFVPTDDGGLWYGVATDVDEAALAAVATDTIDGIRIVGERDEGTLIEIVVTEATLWRTLSEVGGHVSRIRFGEGRPRLVVEAPVTAEPTVVEDLVVDRFPGAELRSQRHVDRGKATAVDAATELDERLTERQRAVAEAALYGGYFDATRKTTGAELAEQFGISKATFHEHLRTATRKIFEVALRTDGEDPHQ